jgi:hypothetical protein
MCFNITPSFWSEMLSNKDAEVVLDNGAVKITLYDHEQLFLDLINEIFTVDGGK